MRTPEQTIDKAANGAIAGFFGTMAMSASMALMQRLLARRYRQKYEPRQVVEGILCKADLRDDFGETAKSSMTVVSHLAFGATAGACYELCGDRLPIPRGLRGPLWGLGVWTASYAGWLPAFDILPAAHKRPAQRNALMIAAHLVWGAATEAIATTLAESRRRPNRTAGRLGPVCRVSVGREHRPSLARQRPDGEVIPLAPL